MQVQHVHHSSVVATKQLNCCQDDASARPAGTDGKSGSRKDAGGKGASSKGASGKGKNKGHAKLGIALGLYWENENGNY